MDLKQGMWISFVLVGRSGNEIWQSFSSYTDECIGETDCDIDQYLVVANLGKDWQ